MKVRDLIRELAKYDGDTEVCVMDVRKNIFNADDVPQGIGIDDNFDVEYMNNGINTPFVALTFFNDDYNYDGTPNEGSLLYSSIENQFKK